MIPIDQASEGGALLRELGGWGVSIVLAGLLAGLLRIYSRLQDHVLKLATALSATNARSVDTMNAAKEQMKDVENKIDRVNERLIELKAMGGGT